MPVVALLNQDGAKIKDITLNDAVFGIEPNQQVIFDVVNAQRAAMRQGTHSTLTRTEVRGGGRKPWAQKGTGRARQGSIRAPQWRGGGIVFGPKPRKYNVKVNRKVGQLGLRSALSYKVLNNLITVVDKIELSEVKTKNFINILNNLNISGKTLVVMNEISDTVNLSSRNIENLFVTTANHVSVYDILRFKNLIVTEETVKYFEEVFANE